MQRDEITVKVQSIFQDIFDDPQLVVTDVTASADIEEWDSIMQINLLVSMEKEFSIKFAISEVSSLKNVGQIIDLIEGKVQ